jgi:hypothetical protein
MPMEPNIWGCWKYHNNRMIRLEDIDFCECVFKVVREIWKEREQ